VGAVILMDEPVLAQREAMQQLEARGPDTRAMGAASTRLMERVMGEEERKHQRALDAAEKGTR
jgi:hypothetical protein